MRFTALLTLLAMTTAASAWTPNPDDPDGGGWPMPPHDPPAGGWVPQHPLPLLPGEILEIPSGWDGWLPDVPFICRLDVPEDYDTIQDAVDAAADDCLIAVAEGTYFENVTVGGKAVRIVGIGDVRLRPSADDAIFTIHSTPEGRTVQLDNLTMSSVMRIPNPIGGEHLVIMQEEGRAVQASFASVRITQCRFDDLAVGQITNGGDVQYGSAVLASWSDLEIDSCDFEDCIADAGGAVACALASLSVSQSTFWDCLATGSGGALEAQWVNLSLRQCEFGLNEATTYGGHIHAVDATVAMERCAFLAGSAAWGAGVASGGSMSTSLSHNQFKYHAAGETGDVWWHDLNAGAGPYLADTKVCSGSSTWGTTEGIVPLESYEDCPFCIDDTTMDGEIGVADLIDLLSVWGTRDPFADVNGDDTVDADDIIDLIEDFGGCGAIIPD